MQILVTGAAGFIGMHVARRLLNEGAGVVGADNLNDYYDPALKEARLRELSKHPDFTFCRIDLADRQATEDLFRSHTPDRVVHLAAQAGVRHSIDHPHDYIESNLGAFLNVLEGCRHGSIEHLVYASSSSVYGGNSKTPFSVADAVDHPVSLYAATKRANELMAHCYSHLYRFPTTGLRFFTVYGPWGRPDMAYFKFARAVMEGRPIDLYNFGDMRRDFTYIDDIVEALARVLARPPAPVSEPERAGASGIAPFRIFNIGNNTPVPLLHMVQMIEQCMGKKTEKRLLPMQAGDVQTTFADVEDLAAEVGFRPSTPLETGIARFVEWFRGYYGEQRAAA